MENDPMTRRFAFFGTPKVASDTLALLVSRGFTPTVVVTSPDTPKGRGLALTPSPTKSLALLHGLSVMTPSTLDAATIESIRAFGCDYAIVVAYGKIFPEELIGIFPGGVLNVHYSLLPKYRGAAPVEAALLAGDEETGVTVQRMVKKLDAGDIIAQQRTAIKSDEGTRELRARLVVMGATLLADTIPGYLTGKITPLPQDHAHATFTQKISKEDGLIDLSQDPLTNYRKIRALNDAGGTYFFTERNGKHIRVRVVSADYRGGTLTITRVTPEGKKEMSYEDFLRGAKTRRYSTRKNSEFSRERCDV